MDVWDTVTFLEACLRKESLPFNSEGSILYPAPTTHGANPRVFPCFYANCSSCKMSADLKSEGSSSAVYCLLEKLIEDGDEDDYRYEEVRGEHATTGDAARPVATANTDDCTDGAVVSVRSASIVAGTL